MLKLAVDQRPLAVFLMGPTASGKTALALMLAEQFQLEIISVDSALVYRGMDIGTAKPDTSVLARFPHRLVSIREPWESYSAAEFRQDALQAMTTITNERKIPLLVGGTGLYFRALQAGLSMLPEAHPELRASLQREAEQCGWEALHARLAAIDPVASTRIKPTDTQRIQRALEVIRITGLPISLQQGTRPSFFPYRVLKMALIPGNRILLHERIANRFDTMLEQNFLKEVNQLHHHPKFDETLPAFRAVGYRQAGDYLAGKTNWNEFRNKTIFATRQLAKRQMTWLRSELDVRICDPDNQLMVTRLQRGIELFLNKETCL